jgi:hypothetical protein
MVSLLAGTLCVGVLDGLAAVLQAVLNDRDPVKSFQFIASGIFGTSAFSGGNTMLAWGILFHFCIAFIWTLIFFVLYPRLKLYSLNWLVAGILYGIVVWVGMNFIVLPLSHTPALPFIAASAIRSVLILITAVGLPLSFLAKRHYDF